MELDTKWIVGVVAIFALLCTAAIVIGAPYVDDPTVKGSDGQWGVECAGDDARTDLETEVQTEDGTAYLSIQGTVQYSAKHRLAVHPHEDREGEVIVFIAPTDEPLEDRSNLDCNRVQSDLDITVRLDDDYRSIRIVYGEDIVGTHGAQQETTG